MLSVDPNPGFTMSLRTVSLVATLQLAVACETASPPQPAEAPQPVETKALPPVEPGTPEARARTLIEASPFAAQVDVLVGALARHVSLHPTRTAMDALAPGASRLAGWPDVPEGFGWPMHGDEPMALLAQLRLADVAPHAPEAGLPVTGWLYFFWAVDSEGWGYTPESADSFRVLFHDGPVEGLTRMEPPAGLPEWARQFEPCSLRFEPGVSLPGWQDLRYPKALDMEQNLEAWYELWLRVTGLEPPGGTLHHLLGHAQLVQGDPRSRAAKHRGGQEGDWNLLLQLETDEVGPNWMWGDMGTVYWLIRDEDLKARKFEEAWLVAQCH